MIFDGFDWYDANSLKIKERVSIEEIESFFKQKLFIKDDTRHSFSEERIIAMGETRAERIMFVAFTMRKKGTERLIRGYFCQIYPQKGARGL